MNRKSITVWMLMLCMTLACSAALAEPDATALLSTAAGELSRCASVRIEGSLTMGIENILPGGVYATGTVDMLRDPLRIKAVGAAQGDEAEAYLRQEDGGLMMRLYANGAWRESPLDADTEETLNALAGIDFAAVAQSLGAQASVAEPIDGVAAHKLEARVDLRGLLGEEAIAIGMRAVLGGQANMQAVSPEWLAEAVVSLYVDQASGRPLRLVADLSDSASSAASQMMPTVPGAAAQELRVQLVMQADFVRYDAVPEFEWPQVPV